MLDPRKDIIGFFEKGTFSYEGNVNKKMRIRRRTRTGNIQKCIEYIENESKDINYDLFKDYFDLVVPSALAKKLKEKQRVSKNNQGQMKQFKR